MSRKEPQFSDRPQSEQEWMLENTWCDQCGAADLGMIDPFEYEEDGIVYVSGSCKKCGETVKSEVIGKDVGSE